MDAVWVVAATVAVVAVLTAIVTVRRNRATGERRVTHAEAERRSALNALRVVEEERTARDSILSAMQEGVLLFGPDARLRFSNAAVSAHLPAVPATRASILPLALREATNRASDGAPTTVEVQVGTPTRWIHGTALPVAPAGAVLLVLTDVTESKRIDAVRRDFVANASHELKTPAASIQAAAETIRTAAQHDPGVVLRFAEQLEREASRLSRIVADLLDLSRLETGSELQDRVRIDATVREERERAEETAERRGVHLAVEIVEPIPTVRGSARDVSLLVRNLVDNAIRYTKPGGRVHVEIRTEDDDVVFVVSDTGIGIPTRDLDRVFERFYRVDRARSRETGGTGLGLSIVRHVIENHGGTIRVESELGRGTRFEVRLPAAR
ncbi:MAG: sensor histidine kinase [Actinomycetota bacterium]